MKRVIRCSESTSTSSWRDRKKMVDVEQVDAVVQSILDEAHDGRSDVYISKRYYKPNFLRYDVVIGFAYPHQSDDREAEVIVPLFNRIKSLCSDKGIKAYYSPSSSSDRGHSFTKYYVQLRIPYDIDLSNITN